mmetsp:Transcript_58182/g.138534  ORF Transcript_58182/g.138534 Transcript_58182/m.138534 type:complete len:234 (-) Transcript_58182:1436-2137(-)
MSSLKRQAAKGTCFNLTLSSLSISIADGYPALNHQLLQLLGVEQLSGCLHLRKCRVQGLCGNADCVGTLQSCLAECQSIVPQLPRDHAGKQCGESCLVGWDTIGAHQLICLPSLFIVTSAEAAAHEACVVDDRCFQAELLFPCGHQIIRLFMGATAAMQLDHGDEGELRRLDASNEHLLEQLLAELVVASVTTALQQVCQDDVVSLEACPLHVLQKLEGSVQVVHIYKGLNEN